MTQYKFEISKTLAVSTAHISQKDDQILGTPDTGQIVVYVKGENGFFVLCEAPPDESWTFRAECAALGLSEAFAALLEFACSMGCSWINIDPDGPEIPFLRKFDWGLEGFLPRPADAGQRVACCKVVALVDEGKSHDGLPRRWWICSKDPAETTIEVLRGGVWLLELDHSRTVQEGTPTDTPLMTKETLQSIGTGVKFGTEPETLADLFLVNVQETRDVLYEVRAPNEEAVREAFQGDRMINPKAVDETVIKEEIQRIKKEDLPTDEKIAISTQRRWEYLFTARGGHKYFRETATGRIALADRSGPLPDTTDDGPLYPFLDRPIEVGEQFIALDVQNKRGDESRTPCTWEEARLLQERFGMCIQTPAGIIRPPEPGETDPPHILGRPPIQGYLGWEQVYRDALDIQNAVNLQAVVTALYRMVTFIARKRADLDTGDLNQHPVIQIVLDKLVDLAHVRSSETFATAFEFVTAEHEKLKKERVRAQIDYLVETEQVPGGP